MSDLKKYVKERKQRDRVFAFNYDQGYEDLKGRKTKSIEHGTSASKVEILNVSSHGIWLSVKGKEHFLSHKDFPWFKDARLSEIQNVQFLHGRNLRWEDLDVDLALESVEHPDRYPLKYRQK